MPVNDPLLTIAVPTLNSARTLGDTLSSLRSASPDSIRLVVADSFSTDGTLDICRQYNVDVVQVPKGNVYKAINVGLNTATTPWIGYVNSDDYVFPGAYRSMLQWALTRDASVVYGRGDFRQRRRCFPAFAPAPDWQHHGGACSNAVSCHLFSRQPYSERTHGKRCPVDSRRATVMWPTMISSVVWQRRVCRFRNDLPEGRWSPFVYRAVS